MIYNTASQQNPQSQFFLKKYFDVAKTAGTAIIQNMSIYYSDYWFGNWKFGNLMIKITIPSYVKSINTYDNSFFSITDIEMKFSTDVYH